MTINAPTLYYVGYSGGLDSTVLLHQLWQQGLPIHALHINHQLQTQANQWAQHCAKQCEQWKIPYTIEVVNAHAKSGESPEAAARNARYAVFEKYIKANTVLCLAHQQDDQAETLLLQLLRGAGVAGLSAMPMQMVFGEGCLYRPLLNTTREALQAYANTHQLSWIEDPSNQDVQYDRNYLRQTIMPLIKNRWPAASQTLSRSAEHCAEANTLLQEIARQDYLLVSEENTLKIDSLNLLTPAQQRQVIRYWLTQLALPHPSTAQLEKIQQELIHAKPDATPLVHWTGVNVRRYQDKLYAQSSSAELDLAQEKLFWDLSSPLKLPGHLGYLIAKQVKGHGILASRLAQQPITVQFRHGGERCHPATRQHSQTLKNLMQEYAIPPWERDSVPLIYCGDEIAAAVGHWLCADYVAEENEAGWVIEQVLTAE